MDQLDLIKLYKMIFIYNALNDGWTIKKLENDKFEFKKSKNKEKRINVNNYLKDFIKKNLSIENILDN
tara:strand:+ start:2485 stop:2688 length:204 start_codon:yes stop_codon:yes gene_type:complete